MPIKENIRKERKSSNGVASNSKTEKKSSRTDRLELSNGESLNSLKREIEELKKSENLMRESLEQAVDSIVTIDSNKEITFYNKAAEKMFGYSREEVIGQNVKMIVPMEHRVGHDNYIDSNVTTGVNKVIGLGRDLEMTRKDGSMFWGNLSLSKIEVGDEVKYTAFIKDITENVKKIAAGDIKDAVDTAWASIEFGPDGTITDVNDNWVKTLGYKKEEMIGNHHRMFCHADYVKTSEYEKLWRDLANGEVQSGEFQRVKNGGEAFWINASYTPVKDTEGKVYKVIKIAADITEMIGSRIQGEAVKAAVDVGWASIEFKTDGTILAANDNFVKTLGYSHADEMVGQHHRMFCDAGYANSSEYQQFWKNLAEGKILSGEFKRITKDEREIYIQASYTPVKDGDGNISKVIKIATEVTDQKVRNSDFEGQIEAVSKAQAVIEFNLDGTAITANDNFLQTVGYSLKEVQGNHHRMFVDSNFATSSTYKDFWAKLNRGEYVTGEFERKAKSGETVWLQASYNPILDLNGNPYKVVKYATDITSQKKALEEVKRVVQVVNDEGNLKERADIEGATGAELDLLESVNFLLEGIGIPVLQVSNIVKSLADGDLTQNVDVDCKGDIKTMSEGLTTAFVNLNELLQSINELANLVAASSEEMTTKSEEMKGSTGEMSSAIQQMAEGVQDQSQQVDGISKLLNDVVLSAKEVADQAMTINKAAEDGTKGVKEGTETVKAVVDSMNEIKESADVTSESINALTKRSEEIARTLNVITDIASQTNLLALNAAIEAARAGDAGRGFAVVAEEIRKLAEDSRNSAQDIEKVIKEVQKDIDLADQSIKRMDVSVKTGNKASASAEKVFEMIDQSTTETFDKSEEITQGAQQQEEAINEAAKSVEKIVVVSEETASGTEQIASSSKNLRQGMDEVSATSNDLAEIANQLLEGISKFKLKEV